MYFAILWKNPEISIEELQLVKPLIEKTINNQIVVFDTLYPERLNKLGWIIKRWEIINKEDLRNKLLETKLIWVSNNNFGLQLKRNYDIKRYKTVDLWHTDLEIKRKWLEIVDMQNLTWIVKGYQNINLYEVVDFDKPARSMQMWMMPAKLTHIMINIWINHISTENQWEINIYDPFTGSYTTWFIANSMWYNFIGSDIESIFAIKNIDWRKNNKFYKSEYKLDFFQHDINNELNLNSFWTTIPNLIVTEWRLGPIVKKYTSPEDVKKAQKDTSKLYETFIKQINKFYITNNETKPTMVFTIPMYLKDNIIEEEIGNLCQKLNFWKFDSVEEIYKRPDQNIGRKIIILS